MFLLIVHLFLWDNDNVGIGRGFMLFYKNNWFSQCVESLGKCCFVGALETYKYFMWDIMVRDGLCLNNSVERYS